MNELIPFIFQNWEVKLCAWVAGLLTNFCVQRFYRNKNRVASALVSLLWVFLIADAVVLLWDTQPKNSLILATYFLCALFGSSCFFVAKRWLGGSKGERSDFFKKLLGRL